MVCACAHPTAAPTPVAVAVDSVDIAAARARGAVQRFTWEAWSARLLAALARADRDPALPARAERTLAAVLTPEAIDHRGSWLGAALLALDDVGAVPWTK